jgi:nitrite reductase/ring-hydroxylating ferredoxin subunit
MSQNDSVRPTGTQIERLLGKIVPEATRNEVERLTPAKPTGVRPLGLGITPPSKWTACATWVPLEGVTAENLAAGRVVASRAGGAPIVVCLLENQLYAYRNSCASCASKLDGGVLDGGLLVCPTCGQRFDIRHAGRAIAGWGLHLDPLPLLDEHGRVKVAVPRVQR